MHMSVSSMMCLYMCVYIHKMVLSPSRVQLLHFMDGSPPGFSVHGILQARTLEWVAVSYSNIHNIYMIYYKELVSL